MKLTESFSTRDIPLSFEEIRASRRSSKPTEPTVVKLSASGAYATSAVRMPAWTTRKGASCTRETTPSGSAVFSPFFRFESGMPQIGQFPGFSCTTLGCIGQKNSMSGSRGDVLARGPGVLLVVVPERVPVGEHQAGHRHEGDEPQPQLDDLDDQAELLPAGQGDFHIIGHGDALLRPALRSEMG